MNILVQEGDLAPQALRLLSQAVALAAREVGIVAGVLDFRHTPGLSSRHCTADVLNDGLGLSAS